MLNWDGIGTKDEQQATVMHIGIDGLEGGRVLYPNGSL